MAAPTHNCQIKARDADTGEWVVFNDLWELEYANYKAKIMSHWEHWDRVEVFRRETRDKDRKFSAFEDGKKVGLREKVK